MVQYNFIECHCNCFNLLRLNKFGEVRFVRAMDRSAKTDLAHTRLIEV